MQREDRNPLHGEEERGKERKGRQKERQPSQSETSLGEIWKMALSPSTVGAELALCQRCSRIAEKDGGRSRFHKRWRQPKGKNRTEMKKEATLLSCTLLNGSAWSTERKYMRRYKGRCDIFDGKEHRLRKKEMEEQFNKEAKEAWRFAADTARITDERAGSEDQKHTSGGVFV